MQNETLAKILREVANLIEGANERRLEGVLAALRTREAGALDDAKRSSPKNRHSKVDFVELQNIIDRLGELNVRHDGYDLLDRLDLSRKELEQLARLRSIHVTKNDGVPKIKEKLVELIIGSKLNSRAIRGE